MRPSKPAFFWQLATAVALTIYGGIAAAQPAQPSPAWAKAEALKLFRQGRQLMPEPGKLDLGCRTLAQSYELHNRGDTLLNLAECHRRQGKTATAHWEFDKAIGHASDVEFDVAIEAAKKARDELAATLSQLTVKVSEESRSLPELAIMLNGVPLPPDLWEKPLSLDPASYTITVSAAGYPPVNATVQLGAAADWKVFEVLLLGPEPPPAQPAPKPEPAKAKP